MSNPAAVISAPSTAYPHSGGGSIVEDVSNGFQIVIHYPKNMASLEKRVSQAHADVVLNHVKQMECSAEQKRAILTAIQRTHEN